MRKRRHWLLIGLIVGGLIMVGLYYRWSTNKRSSTDMTAVTAGYDDYFDDVRWRVKGSRYRLVIRPSVFLYDHRRQPAYADRAWQLLYEQHRKDDHWSNTESLKVQFLCHAGHVIKKVPSWNLEPWRKDVSCLTCNQKFYPFPEGITVSTDSELVDNFWLYRAVIGGIIGVSSLLLIKYGWLLIGVLKNKSAKSLKWPVVFDMIINLLLTAILLSGAIWNTTVSDYLALDSHEFLGVELNKLVFYDLLGGLINGVSFLLAGTYLWVKRKK